MGLRCFSQGHFISFYGSTVTFTISFPNICSSIFITNNVTSQSCTLADTLQTFKSIGHAASLFLSVVLILQCSAVAITNQIILSIQYLFYSYLLLCAVADSPLPHCNHCIFQPAFRKIRQHYLQSILTIKDCITTGAEAFNATRGCSTQFRSRVIPVSH